MESIQNVTAEVSSAFRVSLQFTLTVMFYVIVGSQTYLIPASPYPTEFRLLRLHI
jgi:hypothetical protein